MYDSKVAIGNLNFLLTLMQIFNIGGKQIFRLFEVFVCRNIAVLPELFSSAVILFRLFMFLLTRRTSWVSSLHLVIALHMIPLNK